MTQPEISLDLLKSVADGDPSEVRHEVATLFRFVHADDVEHVRAAFLSLFQDASSRMEMARRQGIITGIQPAVAQTMVELGIDLAAVETRRNLRDGLRECLVLVNRNTRSQG